MIKDWLLYSYDQKYDKDVCSHIYIQHCTEVLVSAVGKKKKKKKRKEKEKKDSQLRKGRSNRLHPQTIWLSMFKTWCSQQNNQ